MQDVRLIFIQEWKFGKVAVAGGAIHIFDRSGGRSASSFWATSVSPAFGSEWCDDIRAQIIQT